MAEIKFTTSKPYRINGNDA